MNLVLLTQDKRWLVGWLPKETGKLNHEVRLTDGNWLVTRVYGTLEPAPSYLVAL